MTAADAAPRANHDASSDLVGQLHRQAAQRTAEKIATDVASITLISELPTIEKKKDLRERRVLPARLRRVSALLAGDGLEEQLLGNADATSECRNNESIATLVRRP